MTTLLGFKGHKNIAVNDVRKVGNTKATPLDWVRMTIELREIRVISHKETCGGTPWDDCGSISPPLSPGQKAHINRSVSRTFRPNRSV